MATEVASKETTGPPEALLPGLELGTVHLTVSNLERSVSWYEHVLGLRVHERGTEVSLGDGNETTLVLHEDPAAKRPGRHAGLYHYALLYPDRRELSFTLRRLAAAKAPLQGMSDHGTHEAIYLADPDGIGIELAADRPPELWPDLGELIESGRASLPLDVEDLLDVTAQDDATASVAEGLRVGHLHFHVGDVRQALVFYSDILGFDRKMSFGSAGFVSANGYHHHLGLNEWQGKGVGPPPLHTAGLKEWTIVVPDVDSVEATRRRFTSASIPVEERDNGFAVVDPWGMQVVIVDR
ncbi:MAG TPA: VOC family protein [Actinomycetota bacterium]|nr:VOC family protein [Actinomycetota bacterium]